MTTSHTLDRALQVYDAVRRPFAQFVADKSWDNGLVFTFNHPEFPITGQESDEELDRILDQMVQRAKKNMSWAYTTYIQDDVKRAFDMLEA